MLRTNLPPVNHLVAADLAVSQGVGVAADARRLSAICQKASTSMTVASDLATRRALEEAGVEFIDENDGGPGVRLRKLVSKTKP